MKERLRRLGRVRLVFVLTVLAIILSVAANRSISLLFGLPTPWLEDVFRATLIPTFLAPLLSWHLTGIFYQMNVMEKEMCRLAQVDDLTSVSNRRFFYSQVQDWLSSGNNKHKDYAFFLIDMDLFKSINDRYGHQCGDQVLGVFGRLLKCLAPSSGIIGRHGGEEFAVFIPDYTQQQAEQWALQLCQRSREEGIDHGVEQIHFSISVGISLNNNTANSTIDLAFKCADLALYEAKHSGRDCYRVFSVRD